ncbi:MAG: acylphosphatase [Pseudomonadota bacterium]|nr:acylphosphatase [Pseudomonadota bacterium]
MIKCFLVSGRVQGVGFRFWVLRRVADIAGISGYVCNLADGNVLVLASGSETSLLKLKSSLYDGPLLARVDNVCETPENISYFPEIKEGVFKRL